MSPAYVGIGKAQYEQREESNNPTLKGQADVSTSYEYYNT